MLPVTAGGWNSVGNTGNKVSVLQGSMLSELHKETFAKKITLDIYIIWAI